MEGEEYKKRDFQTSLVSMRRINNVTYIKPFYPGLARKNTQINLFAILRVQELNRTSRNCYPNNSKASWK
jgi:hypothetical protein